MSLAAAALAVGGTAPALLVLAGLAAFHMARSSDRLLDAAYVAAFVGVGYLAG